MKKFIITVGIVIALGFLGFIGGGMLLPGEFEVVRERRIAASPETLYTAVGHLDTWPEWTPWNPEHYSGLEISFPGRTSGVGAEQAWTMGASSGRLEITSAEAARGITYTLRFDENLAIEGIIEFTATTVAAGGGADGGGEDGSPSTEVPGTNVRWLQRGKLEGAMSRWIGLTLDGSLGTDLEKALEGLERRCAE